METYQLNELMGLMDERDLMTLLADFKCSRNRDSERFLRKTALKHERKSISRTYLMIDTDKKKVMGYITLAFKCLSFTETDMDRELIELMNLNEGVAQAYLIGQLARADDATPGSGRKMIDDALNTFSEGKRKFGCRMVRLDCRDELVEYYGSHGFRHVRKNYEKDLNQMATFI